MSLLLLFYTTGEGGGGDEVGYINATAMGFRQVAVGVVSQQLIAQGSASFTPMISASIRFEVIT